MEPEGSLPHSQYLFLWYLKCESFYKCQLIHNNSSVIKYLLNWLNLTMPGEEQTVFFLFLLRVLTIGSGPCSSVGIATELRTGRSGIEFRWGLEFPPVQTGPGAHPASCKMGIGSFPRVKCGQGLLLTTHSLLVPRSWKSRATRLPILWATTGL